MDPTAVFLGPQGQNADTQERLVLEVLRDHVHWRRGFHPEDPDGVDPFRQLQPAFRATQARQEAALRRLLARLKGSVPFHSPRYLGHMASDTLLPAQIGYLAAMLYNPNNVAHEGSPVTSLLEQEVGRDLAQLVGFTGPEAEGHLCSGGTVANIEALWSLRNLANVPLALEGLHAADLPEVRDVRGAPIDWSEEEPAALVGRLGLEALLTLAACVRRPPPRFAPMAVLVPASRHYSWDKAMNLLGLGDGCLVKVPVDDQLRMDVGAAERILERLGEEGRPVLAMVGVVGTTEAGGVDPIHRLVELRRRWAQRFGQWFFLHVDAAYGGYARALFRRPDGSLRSLEDLARDGLPMRPDLHAAMAAMGEADSITVDPHKLGFVPYPAGALVWRDRRSRAASAFRAAYINPGHEEHMGAFTLEGSRPGAAAAACWLAHRVVPLDQTGYGAILKDSFLSARGLAELLDGRLVGAHRCCVLQVPDLDVVLYAFAPTSHATLAEVNAAQERILSVLDPTGRGPFALTSTRLTPESHGEAVLPFLARLGVQASEWRPGASLLLLRSVLMTPFVADPEVKAYYRSHLVEALTEAVAPVPAPRAAATHAA